jgi:integrase
MDRGIYKRGNIYWISYQDAVRRQIRESSGSTNIGVARKFLAKRRYEVLEGKLGLPKANVPRVESWSIEYLHSVPHPNTRARYSCSCKHIVKSFGRLRLNEITSDLVYRFRDERLREGASPPTVNRDVSVLSGMLTLAFRRNILNANVCRNLKSLNEDFTRREARPFSFEEEERLVCCCSPLLHMLVVLLIETGLRPKREALRLCWTDIELAGPMPSIVIRSSKTRSGIRRVPLTKRCADELRRWKSTLPDDCLWVFPSPRNTNRHWTVYQDQWETAIAASGLSGRRVYDLRSTFATRASRVYPNDRAVAKLLGHSSPAILKSYAKPLEETDILIVKGLEDRRAAYESAQSSNKHLN